MIPCLGALDELCEQSSLADPGLAHETERRRPAPVELGQDPFDRAELVGAPHEMLGDDHRSVFEAP